jgi:hypothetical protein
MIILAYDNRIVLIPDRLIQEARGSLPGIDTEIEREGEHFATIEGVKYYPKD